MLLRLLAALAAMILAIAAAPAVASGRVALLIGNNAYPSSPLRNAINDARDLGTALRELGFQTIVRENTSRAQMIAALQEFGRALEGADAALFFYAGHAMQFKDRNYLIPIDAVMGTEDDVTFFSVDVSQVFDRMERAKTRFNFVILDACRDNPFKDSFKVTAAGLAQMSGPSGSLIAYATAPGATAADGFGRNGVYTGNILQYIKVPDMPVEVLFRKVREGVEHETKRLQTPWELSSIKGNFVFNPSARTAAGESAGAAAGGPSADVAAQLELQFWKSVEGSSRADDIQAYLDKYPNGVYARLARNRIDALLGRSRDQVASASVSSPPRASGGTATPAQGGASTPPSSAPTQAAATKPAASTSGPVPEPAAAVKPSSVSDVGKAAAGSPPAGPAGKPVEVTTPVEGAAKPPAPAVPKEDMPGREIAPGIRELVYADGSVYRGAFRGLKLHGRGEYSAKNFRYEGEFRDGLKHGSGTYVWENGDRYEGGFEDDRPSGKGKWQFVNGDSYEGELKAGVITGRGVYVTRAGDRIEGSFVNGVADGSAIYRFASGDRYEGEMAAGKLQGKGRYYTKDGDRIEGVFADGKPQGKGVYHFANGDRYEGDIEGGALTGKGAYFHANGSKYEGEMVAARPQGKGTFWFLDGSRFEGAFENGLARATGEMVKPDGARRKAEIVEGQVKLLD